MLVRFALSCAIAAAIVGFSFTPPGRAMTGDIADLVGIGGPPTIDHDEQGGSLDPMSDEIVIAAGETADGARYELVAFQATHSERFLRRQEAKRERIADTIRELDELTGRESRPDRLLPEIPRLNGTCIAVDWIGPAGSHGSTGTTCIEGAQHNPLSIGGISDTLGRYGPAVKLIVSGMTGPKVARVDVSYERPDGRRVVADGALGRLEGELAEKAGTSEELGKFVAFIPAADVGPGGYRATVVSSVEVVAYAANGEEIKHVDYGTEVGRSQERSRQESKPIRFADTKVFPLLDAAGRPIPGSRDIRTLRTAGTCKDQSDALRDAGHDFDAYAGTRCPSPEAVDAFIESGASIPEPE